MASSLITGSMDWAEEIQYLCDVMYPRAERIVLVMDNLNTHALGSLYKRFKPDVARRLAGSWRYTIRRSMAAS